MHVIFTLTLLKIIVNIIIYCFTMNYPDNVMLLNIYNEYIDCFSNLLSILITQMIIAVS